MAESKDNVRVAIRVRPLNERETREAGGKKCVSVQLEHNSITIDSRPEPKMFTYDYVADEYVSQEYIFDTVGKPIASSCIDGYNGTIFAYGQTGAGKTFTIQGPDVEDYSKEFEESAAYEHRGLLPRCFEYIFSSINEEMKETNVQYLVRCSYLEIYQEQVMDLLDNSTQGLQIREDMKRGIYVEGLIEENVNNVIDTYALLKVGARNRHVGSTSMNKESSRSHSVFTLHIESKQEVDGLVNFKCARFHLIDLAGSERQKSTDAAGERLKEAGMINKSLSALGNVINSLVELSEGKNRHVHYRDSKLTYLLKDSLGGNSKTFIVANISSSVSAFGETLSTLKFAQRAKLIRNKAVINEDTSGTVKILRDEVRRLKDELNYAKNNTFCNKCNGMISSRDAITINMDSSERIGRLETLIDHNLKMRQDTVEALQNKINDKDLFISSLQETISKYENKVNNDKMVLKFREATIARFKAGEKEEVPEEIERLHQEIAILKDTIESHPVAAKLYSEKETLKKELEDLKREFRRDPTSIVQQLKESEIFSRKLSQALSDSVEERESLGKMMKELEKKIENQLERKIDNQLERKIDNELERKIDSNLSSELEINLPTQEEIIKIKLEYGEKIDCLNKSLHEYERKLAVYERKIVNQEGMLRELYSDSEIMKTGTDLYRLVDESILVSNEGVDELFKESSHLKIKLDTADETEVMELVKNNENLESENQQLKQMVMELDQILKESQKHEETLTERVIKISEIEREKDEERAKVSRIEQELNYWKEKLQEKNIEGTRLTQELENSNEEHSFLKSQLEDLNILIRDKDKQLLETNRILTELKDVQTEQQMRIQALQSEDDILKNSINENMFLKDKLEGVERKLIDVTCNSEEKDLLLRDLHIKLEEFKKNEEVGKEALIDLQSNLKTLKKEKIDNYKEQFIEQLKKQKDLHKDISRLQAYYSLKQCKIEELEMIRDEMTVYRDINAEMLQVNSKLLQNYSNSQNFIQDLTTEIQELKNEKEALEAAYTEEKAILTNDLNKQFEEVDAYKSTNGTLKESLVNQTQSVQDLTLKLTSFEDLVDTLNCEKENQKAEYANEKAKFMEEIEKLKDRANSVRIAFEQTSSSSKTSIQEAQQETEKLKSLLEKSEEEKKDIETNWTSEVQENKAYIDKLSKELTSYKLRDQTLMKQIEDLRLQIEELNFSISSISEREKETIKLKEDCANYISLLEQTEKKYSELKDEAADYIYKLQKADSKYSDLKEELKMAHSKTTEEIDSLVTEIQEQQRDLNHYQDLSVTLSQKNAELTCEIARLEESSSTRADSLESSKGTIDSLKEEIKNLKEDNRAKMEILQNTNKNILATRNEINMWKKCIDDKNISIQDLRKEIRKKDEEIFKLQKAYNSAAEAPIDAQTELKHLKTILHLKESELYELKAKGQSYYSQADEILESQKKEIDMLRIRSSKLEDELRDCMEERDELEAEIDQLKSEEHINIKKNDEVKALIEKFREEKSRLLKDLEILNKENGKLAGHNNLAQKIKVHERMKEENNSLKGQLQRMKEELQHKSDLINQIQRKAPELKRKSNIEEILMQKQLEKQSEEINNLTEGLAKITDYVFGLPIVAFNPEETCIIESTISAISKIYETLEETEKVLQEKERELTNFKTRMNLMESENKIWKHKNEISQVPSSSSLISGSSFKSPVAHYHALLNASSIKPSDFLAPFDNSKTPPKQRYRK